MYYEQFLTPHHMLSATTNQDHVLQRLLVLQGTLAWEQSSPLESMSKDESVQTTS